MSYHIISYHIILCNSWAPNIFWLVSEFKLFKPISVANVPSLSPWGKHRKREDSRAYGFYVPKWICTHVCFCCFHIYDNFLQGNQQIYTQPVNDWLVFLLMRRTTNCHFVWRRVCKTGHLDRHPITPCVIKHG